MVSGKTTLIFIVLLCALGRQADAVAPLAPNRASTPIPDGANNPPRAVALMVGGIASFTRWPGSADKLILCVLGPARFGSALAQSAETARRPVIMRSAPSANPRSLNGCDIVYMGTLARSEVSRILSAIRGKAMLSIAEVDPGGCRSGAMFCLQIAPDRLSFLLNVDAIARSPLRVDPRVLRLADANLVAP